MKIYEAPTISIRFAVADVLTESDPSVKDIQWGIMEGHLNETF